MNTKKILLSLLIFVLAIILVWLGIRWWQIKKMQIKLGVASDKFPYRAYTQDELNKMYPQIKNADIPTRATPEQTYAKFREALRTNNLEMAIEQLSKESAKYEENKGDLENFYKENKFPELFRHYSDTIRKANIGEAIAQYEYDYFSPEYKTELIGTIDFEKDSEGDWRLTSL